MTIQPSESESTQLRPVPGTEHRSRLIRITARMGVWGLVAALVPPLATALSGPVWLGTMTPLVAAGLVTSGLGTMAASALVLSALPSRVGPLNLAALAGIPFGLTLTLGGSAVLVPLSRFADIVDAGGLVVLALGLFVVISLVVGFLIGGPDG